MKNSTRTILSKAYRSGHDLHIDLQYPDSPCSDVRKFVIGLIDVLHVDDIRVSYDRDRNGWKIEQASTFEWKADDKIRDSDWQEVAFIEAWARKRCTQSKTQSPKSKVVKQINVSDEDILNLKHALSLSIPVLHGPFAIKAIIDRWENQS